MTNSNSAKLSPPVRSRIQRKLNYNFKQESLLIQALTHKSFSEAHNERLEFLGDAVLGQVVAAELFERYPEATEAVLTLLRSQLVRKESLALVGHDLDLSSVLILGPGEKAAGAHVRDSLLSNAVEALIGAIYLDADYAVAAAVIRQWLRDQFEGLDPEQLKDNKTRLQELLQGRGSALPHYELKRTFGAQHAQRFEILCVVASLELESTGSGTSRRGAEQEAAGAMLLQIESKLLEPTSTENFSRPTSGSTKP